MTIDPKMSHPVALLVDEVLRLTPRFKSIFSQAPAAFGLSTMEITVLAAAIEAPRSPTVPQIGRSLGHPRQVIQRAANALIERRLLAATTNPDHKRAPLLVPTDEGRSVKRQVDERAMKDAHALQAAMPDGEFERLGRELRALRHKTEAYIRERSLADGDE